MSDTISVVYCALNEEERLPKQLAATLPQLRPDDELILTDDGSTDSTWDIIQYARMCSDRVRMVRNREPSGVLAAYQKGIDLAEGDWVFATSVNDELQPGALDAFRLAMGRWPNAKLIVGRQHPPLPGNWLRVPDSNWYNGQFLGPGVYGDWLSPEMVRKRWTGIVQLTGMSAITRRGFRPPYDPRLEWNADWWALNEVALRHGLAAIDFVITKAGPAGWDAAGEDPVRLRPVLDRMKEKLKADPFLAEAFAGNPKVMRWIETGEH